MLPDPPVSAQQAPAGPGAALRSARRPGDVVGPYELVGLLGRGGMGEVWEAVLLGAHGFRRAVALKLLRAPRDASHRAALLAEARIGGLLAHPNVVAIQDAGEDDGVVYIAMDLVHGVSAYELARAEPLSLGAIVAIGAQVARGLHHCHSLQIPGVDAMGSALSAPAGADPIDDEPAGLVHRDVKPRNVLVDRYGTARIADLGIARVGRRDLDDDEVTGTIGFMAPEQLQGTEDARADIFSLGVTLYTLAMRRLPFGAVRVTTELVRRELDAVMEGVEPRLASVLRTCMQPDPEDRFATAQRVADTLSALRIPPVDLAPLVRRVLRESPTTPPPPPPRPTLPDAPDGFHGRARELAALVERVRGEDRLLTLAGPGGIGKSRLALELARRCEAAPEPIRAWRCDLATATDGPGMWTRLGATFGIPLDAEDPVAQLGHALRVRGRMLVLLDGVEGVAREAAAALGRWIDAAPDVTWLVTSRVPLRVADERVLTLGPLDAAAAVALFRDRAGAETGSDGAVASLVRSLDNLPLAIELAAARARREPLAEVVARIEALLDEAGDESESDSGGRRRTLRASVAGSLEQLAPWEREALAQLGAFEDGFALEAAVAVLDLRAFPGAPSPAAVVRSLYEQSLLTSDPRDGRYGLLATIRSVAAAGRSEAARRADEARHAAHFAHAGSAWALSGLDRAGGEERRRKLAPELGNLVAATRRAAAAGQGDEACATALAAWVVCADRGPVALGVELLRDALPVARERRREVVVELGRALGLLRALDEAKAVLAEVVRGEEEDELRIRALLCASALALQTANVREAGAMADEALRVARIVGDPRWEGSALAQRGAVAHRLGDGPQASLLLETALIRLEQVRDRRGEAEARIRLGLVLRDLRRPDEARAALQAALAVARRLGSVLVEARALGNLGVLAHDGGRLDEAEALYREALELHRRVGHPRSEAIALGNLGAVATSRQRWDEAIRCLTASAESHRRAGEALYEAHAIAQLASVLRDAGRPLESLGRFDEAFDLYRRAGATSEAIRALRSSAPSARRLGRRSEELARLQQALELAERPEDVAVCRLELVLARVAAGDMDQARIELVEAQRAARATTLPYARLGVAVATAMLRDPGDERALVELRGAAAELPPLREPWLEALCWLELCARAPEPEATAALDRAEAAVSGRPFLEAAEVLWTRADRETDPERARALREAAQARARALGASP